MDRSVEMHDQRYIGGAYIGGFMVRACNVGFLQVCSRWYWYCLCGTKNRSGVMIRIHMVHET